MEYMEEIRASLKPCPNVMRSVISTMKEMGYMTSDEKCNLYALTYEDTGVAAVMLWIMLMKICVQFEEDEKREHFKQYLVGVLLMCNGMNKAKDKLCALQPGTEWNILEYE